MLIRLKRFVIESVIVPVVRDLSPNIKTSLYARAFADQSRARGLTRETLARIYLRGEGLEVGALNSPLRVPDWVTVKYVDVVPSEELERLYPELKLFTRPDIVEDGMTLKTILGDSQDFVVANHVIEHAEDPIGTIGNWFRVLKVGGILFAAIPDKRFTFDYERPVTMLNHLLRDHQEGPEWSRRGHYEETYRVSGGVTDENEIARLSEEQMHTTGHVHFHVWSQAEMFEFIAALKRIFDFEIEAYTSVGNEGIFILRKGDRGRDRSLAERSLTEFREMTRAAHPQLAPVMPHDNTSRASKRNYLTASLSSS